MNILGGKNVSKTQSSTKHTLEEVRAEYDRLDKLCNADTSHIDLRISHRATHRYGYCHYVKRFSAKCIQGFYAPDYISITDFILECEEQFWDTIRHEYAHALVTLRDGKLHRHDGVWKSACCEVGCKPKRTATDREAGRRSAERRKQNVKYIVRCKKCGRTWTYIRAGSVVKSMKAKRNCTCPCGSHDLVLTEK